MDKVSRQLSGLLPGNPGRIGYPCQPGTLLALAFPDRIAQKNKGSAGRYRLNSGRGVFLLRHDPLSASDYLVVAAMDAGQKEGRIFMAAPLEKRDLLELFTDQLIEQDEIKWSEQTQSVVCTHKVRLGALTLDKKPMRKPDPESVQSALVQAIGQKGLDLLPWDTLSRSIQDRVNCLRIWQPDEEWPDLGETSLAESLAQWLGPFLGGIRNMEQIQTLNMAEILLSRLEWKQQKKLEEDAPTHIVVPSGSRIKLQYKAGEPPVLAVRLQEMFGLAQNPTVCRGRVPVLLHLLSPASRPIQVTSDLKSFWDSSYHEVKKELKGRYPKHYWPDDPWQANPTKRVKPKKKQEK